MEAHHTMYDPKSSEQEALWEECTIQAMDLYVTCEQLFARCTGADDRTWIDTEKQQQSWEGEGGAARSVLREVTAPQFPRASREVLSLLVDCSEAVRLMQGYLLRRSDFVPVMAGAVAEICDTCAEEFERLPVEEGWGEIAETCREFSELLDQVEYEEPLDRTPEGEASEGENVA